MGMYDYINGDQVKLFYIPIFDEVKKDTWHSGGTLHSFATGDIIPSKTLYYKLPKDFLILKEDSDYNQIEVHIIEDSKVMDTVNIHSLDDSFFSRYSSVLNHKGTSIKIKSKEDCVEYIKDSSKKFHNINKARAEISDIINNELNPLYTIQRYLLEPYIQGSNISPYQKAKNIKNTLSRYTKLKLEIFKLLNIASLEELKQLLTEDIDCSKKTEDIILNYVRPKIDHFNFQVQELNKKNKPSFEEIIEKYNDKWINENKYKKEIFFGELLYCFQYAYSEKDDKVDDFLGDPFEKYLALKNTIKDLLTQNPGLIESYSKWQEFNKEEESLIKDLSDFLLNSKDGDAYKGSIYSFIH